MDTVTTPVSDERALILWMERMSYDPNKDDKVANIEVAFAESAPIPRPRLSKITQQITVAIGGSDATQDVDCIGSALKEMVLTADHVAGDDGDKTISVEDIGVAASKNMVAVNVVEIKTETILLSEPSPIPAPRRSKMNIFGELTASEQILPETAGTPVTALVVEEIAKNIGGTSSESKTRTDRKMAEFLKVVRDLSKDVDVLLEKLDNVMNTTKHLKKRSDNGESSNSIKENDNTANNASEI